MLGNANLSALLIVITLFLWIYNWFTTRYSSWSRLGVYCPAPKIPFGNVGKIALKKETILDFWTRFYRDLREKNLKFGGCYSLIEPFVLLADLDLCKCILSKDFDYFRNRGTYYDEEGEPMTAHLVSLNGAGWKKIRSKLTPAFSNVKLKSMFPILHGVCEQLNKCLEAKLKMSEDVDMKEILEKFTSDVIGECAFGIDCDALENPKNSLYVHSKKMAQQKFLSNHKVAFARMCPQIFKFFGFKIIDEEFSRFYMDLTKGVIGHRKKNNIVRNDFMQQLIGHMDAPGNEALTINEVAAQVFIFILGGFETSAAAMTFALFELAANEEIQEKLRAEIVGVASEKLTYECVSEMPYLDKVISETLRKYPPFPITIRESTEDYTMPGTKIVLHKGTPFLIPIFPIHRDPAHHSNPELFDPERFSHENKKKLHQFAYIPFGEGPRNCIGRRLALLIVKVGVCKLISKFKFTESNKTQLPLEFSDDEMTLTARGQIWVKASKIALG